MGKSCLFVPKLLSGAGQAGRRGPDPRSDWFRMVAQGSDSALTRDEERGRPGGPRYRMPESTSMSSGVNAPAATRTVTGLAAWKFEPDRLAVTT